MSSPLSVVVFVVFLVVILSKPSPLLAKVPKRFPLLISFPSSSSSHRRDDDFPTPFPPHEEREEEDRDKGAQGDTAKGLRPFQVRRINTFIKDMLSLSCCCCWCCFSRARGESLRFWTSFSSYLFSLSLLLSSGICLALGGGERPQRERERERERETEERLCTRAKAHSFSLFLFGARFLSPLGFPEGE